MKRIPPQLAEIAYIGVAAIVAIPVAGRVMHTDLWKQAEGIPLAGVLLRGVRAWSSQVFNP